MQNLYTAKDFSFAVLSIDDILRFFLFPKFCSTSSLAETVNLHASRFALLLLIAQNEIILLARVIFARFLFYTMHTVCDNITFR